MKNLILFAVLLSALGCQAPKDRSGDAGAPPQANPNSTDPKVKTQVEPRVIVLPQEDLKVTIGQTKAPLNTMEKDNLAEQSIEKTFIFDHSTPIPLVLRIEGESVITKSECVSEENPTVHARHVLNPDDGKVHGDLLDIRLGTNILVEGINGLELTVTVTNPGQCKKLSYKFAASLQ